jgi:hypothetical protein
MALLVYATFAFSNYCTRRCGTSFSIKKGEKEIKAGMKIENA